MSNIPEQTRKLVEFIANASTNPLERARAIGEVISKHNVNKSVLAEELHKSPSYISNYLRLLALPEVIQDALLSGIISEGHSRALSFLSDRSDMVYLFEEILRHGYSVRAVEERVNKLRASKRRYGKVNPEITTAASVMHKALGVPVAVTRRANEVVMTINFPVGMQAVNKVRKLSEIMSRYLRTEE